jgi:AraC-like DNA-binding protein
MQHVEFFDREHFEYNFHRRKAIAPLDTYIDFFWESRFDHLWEQTESFNDLLFSNVGYTYLVNLGTPFSIQLDRDEPRIIKSDAFLPRYRNILTEHRKGNCIFGIKFTISPNLLEKPINFSEYRQPRYSLAYLIHADTLKCIKNANNFSERVAIATAYYRKIIHQHEASSVQVKMVKNILAEIKATSSWNKPVSEIASQHGVDVRTLQRYFEATTSSSTKQAIQMLKIRSAIASLIESPETFYIEAFGFYDRSHFYKQMYTFFDRHPAFDRSKYLPLLHQSPVKIRY